MIVLDTTVLVYATGGDHPARTPCARLVDAIGDGLAATTTVEVIQEFVHVRTRRAGRETAVELGRRYLRLLEPLLAPDETVLERGLDLYARHPLGMFDSVLAATAIASGVRALVSAHRAFGQVPGLRHIDPTAPASLADLGVDG